MSAKDKNPDILRIVREAAKHYSNQCRFTHHAFERMFEQDIALQDAVQVLLSGRRKTGKDSYDPEIEGWKYAFEHEIDERVIRVIVSQDRVEETIVIVITAIDVKYGKR